MLSVLSHLIDSPFCQPSKHIKLEKKEVNIIRDRCSSDCWGKEKNKTFLVIYKFEILIKWLFYKTSIYLKGQFDEMSITHNS